MTRSRLVALCLAGAALAACGEDNGVGAAPPIAGVRFINAVADTGAMDFRVVDIVGDAPQFLDNTYRTATSYQAVEAGDRHLRVFLTPSRTDTFYTPPVMWDTTFTFTEGVNYSVIMSGYANPTRGVSLNMIITTDDATEPAAGQFGLRIINLGTALGSVDAYTRRGTAAAPGTAYATDVVFGGVAPYGVQATDTNAFRVLVAAAGTTTPALADVAGPAGVAGTSTVNPIAGTNVERSVLTAILVPASVAGTGAGSFATPSVLFVTDRRPPLTVPAP